MGHIPITPSYVLCTSVNIPVWLVEYHAISIADHKNIAYGNLTNDCIIRWRLLLEEFGPKYEHIAGKDNVVADALSRMEMQPEKAHKSATEAGALAAYCMSTLIRDEAVEFHAHWANDEICRLR